MATKAKQSSFDPKKFLATANGGRTIAKYRIDDVIFAQGSFANAVFYIRRGKVKITVVSGQGKEAVLGVLGPGEFCGEACLMGRSLRLSTATAMTACEITRIEKEAIVRVLNEEPAFSELFVSHLLARNARVEADLIDHLFNSSEKRLARALLMLAHYGKESPTDLVVPKISQETLADMIGTTRSRVSYFMNKFRELGLISYNGQLIIHRSLLNFLLADEPGIKG
jgi:CRP/FNR family transcriptional regulator, cyclic AMP receptor protein